MLFGVDCPQCYNLAVRALPSELAGDVLLTTTSSAEDRSPWQHVLLVLILLVAFLLRAGNIAWDEGKLTHPDERSTVAFYAPTMHWPTDWSTAFNPQKSTFNPLWDRQAGQRRSYTYGHFPLYLLTITADVASRTAPLFKAFGALPETVSFVRTLKGVPGYAYVGRFLMAVADTFTVYLVYLIARKLYGRRAGLLAAALSAFTVTQIQLAHFFAVDPISGAFTMLALYGAMLMFERQDAWSAVVTGVGCGLAIASKFSALPIVAAPLVATLMPMAQRWWASRRTTTAEPSGAEPRGRSVPELVGLLLLSLLVAFLVLVITSPFVFLDWGNFAQAVLNEQGAMVRGEADFPFTRQYRGTLPYVYYFEQQLKWGMGWPLGIVGLLGLSWVLVRAVAGRARTGEWILLSWLVPYFGLTGLFLAKFMRYMVPVVPLLTVMGVGLLTTTERWFAGRREPAAAGGRRQGPRSVVVPLVALLVLVATVVWALAFVNGVYGRTHTWIAASRWIYANVPDGSVLASEHWDDDLPLGLPEPGADMGSHGYRVVDLPMYEEDNQGKYEIIRSTLREADYIILASNRLYRSIPRLPERYPMTTKYYDLLFAGQLGFEIVAEFTSYPTLGPLTFPDDDADESFTVYDHPKPIVFQKTRQLSEAEWDGLLGGSWSGAKPWYVGEPILLARLWPGGQGRPAVSVPREEEQRKSLLLDVPVDELPVVNDFRWNRWASQSTVGAVVVWWLALTVLGLVAWPLTFVVFRHMRGRGYLFARALGWLIVGYINWLLASLGWMKNSLLTIGLGILLLGLLSYWLWRRNRPAISEFWRAQRPYILFAEGLFLAAYLGFVGIRLLNPDLWQPWQGGEKFMEFAFLNAITRSAHFPPYDPYFAGGYMNYYYYGQYLVAMLIKLTGIQASVAFNLAVPTLFALTVAGAFSVVYALVPRLRQAEDEPAGRWSEGLGPGLLASLFVTLTANLDGLGVVLRRLGEVSGSGFVSRLPFLQMFVRAAIGLWRITTSGQGLPAYNYWESSRVIPATINEFPYWSFLFADLHPHMIGIPFTVLFVGLALNMLLSMSDRHRRTACIESGLGYLVLPLVLGAIGAINTWDLPTYLGLGVLVYLVREWHSRGRIRWLPAAFFALFLTMLSLGLYYPFFRSYEAVGASGVGLVKAKTDLGKWLGIWGFFAFVAFSYIAVELRQRRGRSGVLRAVRLGLERWEALPRLGRLHSRLVSASTGYVAGWAALGLLVVLTIVLAVLKYTVPATLLLPLAAAGALLLRRRSQADAVFVTMLVFVGLLVLLGVEVVYLKDFLQGGDYRRMNTLFKFYIQVWVLLGIGSAAAMPRIWRAVQTWRSRWAGAAWSVAFALLFGSSLVFVVLGTPDRVNDRFPGERPALGTLDGMAFMTVGSYTWPDASNRIELAYDDEAINWLLENVRGTPVVAEGRIDYYREGGMRMSSFTGLPTLLGAHQSEQRYGDTQVGPRETLANEFFSTTDTGRAEQIIDELHISYIYIGKLERTVYSAEGVAKFQRMADLGLLTVPFRNPEVVIYQVAGPGVD
jgi:YYY domain-containing protein